MYVNIVRGYGKYVLITAVFGLGVYWLFGTSTPAPITEEEATAPAKTVSVQLTGESLVGGVGGSELELSGVVEAATDIDVFPEASGTIARVAVAEGDTVTRGRVLLELANAQERVAVAQAQARLEQEQIALAALRAERDTIDSSTVASVIEQQDVAVENAHRKFLNNDLRAYADDPTVATYPNPVISGVYNSLEEGKYIIETYRSSARSGQSVRLRGMESDTFSASTNQPTALGTRGLFVQFVLDEHGRVPSATWVVNIPNTRSATYVAAQADYQSALEDRDVSIKQTEVTQKDIEKQEAVVRQQELSVQAANIALAKTIVRAPVSGTVTAFDLGVGDYVENSAVATIKSLDQLEVVTYVTDFDRLFVQPGNKARIEERAAGEVVSVGVVADKTTQKIKVRIAVDSADRADFDTVFTEGQAVSVVVERVAPKHISDTPRVENVVLVPLTAVQIVGTTSYVFTINQETNTAQAVPVSTGALFGDAVLITDGLADVSLVITDGRGLSDGEAVTIE